jgi:hypothetical protein
MDIKLKMKLKQTEDNGYLCWSKSFILSIIAVLMIAILGRGPPYVLGDSPK